MPHSFDVLAAPFRFLVVGAITTAAVAQTPRFAEVGESLPDGMGQLAAAADFEGDGDVDLFTHAGVFLNTGGFFRAGPTLALGVLFNVRSIEVADLTGDGRVDVLVGHVSGPRLFVAPPAGGTSFTQATNAFPGATSMAQVCVADVDGDGDRDVFAARPSTAVTEWRLFVNNGTGGFVSAPTSQWAAATFSPSWIGAGDFDDDGLPDAVAIGYPTGGEWRRNLGGGNFGPSAVLSGTVTAERGVIGDFDGDGTDDVFIVAPSGMESVLMGSPSGLLGGTPVFGGILAAPPLAADFDGDQRTDLVRSIVPVSGGTFGDVVFRPGTPAGLGPAFPYRAVRFAYGSPMPFPGVAVADVDGDGDRDVVLAPGAEAPLSWINTGAGGYVTVPKAVPAACGSPWVPLRDLDGDGDPDLLRADIQSGQLVLTSHRNDGRGNFAAVASAAGAVSYTQTGVPTWCDLDRDGDEDLWVRQYSGSHTVLINDGTGVFSANVSIGGVTPTSAVAFGDFDGDLDVDVVVGRSVHHLTPFLNHPPVVHFGQATPSGMTYTSAAAFGIAEVITEFVVLDTDFDFDLDLVCCNTGGVVRTYANNGFGSFTLASSPAGSAMSIATGDVNSDNTPDLVLGNQTWLNNAGSWAAGPTHSAPIGRISLADVDGDGDLDLLDAAGRWYEGDNTGAFAAPVAIVPYPLAAPVATATLQMQPVDVDSDGDLDVLGPQVDTPTIYSNLTRHAARASLMAQGTTATLAVFGAPATPWFLGVSHAMTTGLPLPPFGTLFLDPGSLLVFTGGVTGAAGRSDVPWQIPLGPSLAGLTLSWQALITNGFTNGFDTVILP